ncbi:MAG: YcaO-like family protein [Bdellovibrio sp.]
MSISSSAVLEQTLQEMQVRFESLESDESLQVSFGRLLTSDGNPLSYGSANGSLHKIKVIAECIEHACFTKKSSTQTTTLRQIMQQKEFQTDRVLRSLDSNISTQTVSFQRWSEPQKSVQVPAIWCMPVDKTAESLPASLYSSSGFSFGLHKDMSLQHGLLELIERHEVSHLLYALDHHLPWKVRKLEQPPLAKELEKKFAGSLEVFEISRIFSVPTVFCIFYPDGKNSRFPLPQTSSKTAIHLETALTGAISEMTQILFLYSDEEYQEDLAITQNELLSIPHFSALFLEELRKSSPHSFMPATSLPKDLPHLDVAVKKIEDQGYFICERTVQSFASGACVSQVFIAGFEKYNLIRLGIQTPWHGTFGDHHGL